jgi:DNA-binding NarL/FixJ family response regulator
VEHELSSRILIVDDLPGARIAIRELLDWHSFQVCGEAKDGRDAIERVIQLKPDIILLDINMPGMNGVAAAHEIRRISPETKIVFLTIHNSPAVVHALRSWSNGFVSKSDAGTQLIPTLSRLIEIPPASEALNSRRAGIS